MLPTTQTDKRGMYNGSFSDFRSTV